MTQVMLDAFKFWRLRSTTEGHREQLPERVSYLLSDVLVPRGQWWVAVFDNSTHHSQRYKLSKGNLTRRTFDMSPNTRQSDNTAERCFFRPVESYNVFESVQFLSNRESKKTCSSILRRNFGKCWLIFKILSLLDSERNLQQNYYRTCHHTLTVLFHYRYLVKYRR